MAEHDAPHVSESRPWRAARGHLPGVIRYLDTVSDEPGSLGDVLRHQLGHSGKRTRALLALAACDALGVRKPLALALASACELLHEASLVHDDLQDRDPIRRGRASVFARFGDDAAVNAGDFLLTRAIDVAVSMPAPERVRAAVVGALTQATLDVIRGQMRDNAARGDLALGFDAYEAIARGKTGRLLALPVEGALLLGDLAEPPVARAREALGCLGVAYQLQDDLADLLGRKDGRAAGGDLCAGRPSAPVLHFAAVAAEHERARFRAFVGTSPSAEQTAFWIRRICASGAVEATIARARARAAEATAGLAALPGPLAATLDLAARRMIAPLDAMGARARGRTRTRPPAFGARAAEGGAR